MYCATVVGAETRRGDTRRNRHPSSSSAPGAEPRTGGEAADSASNRTGALIAVDILEQLEHKRETALQLIEAIPTRAADEGRELSEGDRSSIDSSNVNIRQWNADL